MNIKKEVLNIQIFTVIIFILLLSMRILTTNSIAWIFNNTQQRTWLDYYYLACTYILSALVIWLNRNHLADLHITRFFIQIFILSGVIIFMIYVPIELGILIGITTIITSLMFYRGKFVFGPSYIDYRLTFTIFLLILAILFGPILIATFIFHTNIPWSQTPLDLAVIRANLPLVIFEEVLFRGILWMLLKNFKVGERKILIIQTLVFWLSHYYYYSKFYIFWIAFPLVSLLLGIIVFRTKSLTPSTILHFFLNILVGL